jgi:DHA1 family inner membrane transport protein
MTLKERVILFLTAAINFTHILDFMIMMPLGNHLIPLFHLSTTQFSWLVAAYTITAGITGFVAGFFMDKYDRKKALLVTFSGFVIGTFCCGSAPSYSWLLTARMITGAFGGIIASQVLAIVADTFPYERRGMAIGVVMSSISVASIAGVPLALWMVNRFSWQAPFILTGAIGLSILPLAAQYLPSMNRHLKEQQQNTSIAQTLSAVVRNTPQITGLGLTATLMLGHYLIIPFVNPYLQFNVGFNNQQTPLIYLMGGLAVFISSPLIGRLTDQFGKLRIYLLFALVSLIPVLLITNLSSVHYLIVLLITSCWFTLSAGRIIPAQAMITNVAGVQQRGSFMSFNSSIQQLFIGLASVLSGVIVSQDASGRIVHYNWLGYLSIILIAFSMLLARRLAQIAK